MHIRSEKHVNKRLQEALVTVESEVVGRQEKQLWQSVLNKSNDYVWPVLSAENEYASLLAHTQYFKRTSNAVKPSLENQELVLNIMETVYGSIRTTMIDWFNFDNFKKVLFSLDFQSTPGYPYLFTAPTIGDYLKFNGDSFDSTRVSILWNDVNNIINDLDDEDIYWRTFIKQEPHKISKAQCNRWRLITCPPLSIQVLWQMCFASQNRLEIDDSYNLPTQQGIVMPYGGWKNYYQQWLSLGLACSTDMTAWDWTCPSWLIDMDLRFRKRLTNSDSLWLKMVDFLYNNAFYNCKIILSDGRVFRQLFPGIIKSGCVNTISTNGHCQVMLHVMVCIDQSLRIDFPRVVGDDKLQSISHYALRSSYEKYGVIIKSITDTMEFVGNQWTDNGPQPMYTGKHVFNLLHASDENIVEIFDSYLRFYSYSDLRHFVRWLSKLYGVENQLKSDQYYRYWYDNPNAKILKDIVSNLT
nr:MAG: RNA-dependent RNA polymerase [XiangYun luteo-sobemo-like virus 2]